MWLTINRSIFSRKIIWPTEKPFSPKGCGGCCQQQQQGQYWCPPMSAQGCHAMFLIVDISKYILRTNSFSEKKKKICQSQEVPFGANTGPTNLFMTINETRWRRLRSTCLQQKRSLFFRSLWTSGSVIAIKLQITEEPGGVFSRRNYITVPM